MKGGCRLLLVISALGLGGCAEFWSWNAPPQRNFPEAGRAPVERPMQLIPEGYRVAKGDTLYSIAFRNNLDFHDLAQWNGIGSDYRIVPGQVLRLTPPSEPAQVVIREAPQPPSVKPVEAQTQPQRVAEPGTAPKEFPSGYGWQWPTAGTVLRGYAPAQGAKGIDFTGNLGQPVFAAAPGRVVYSGNALKGYGELIIIKHDELHLSAYGYNRRRYVVEGDVVTAGQPIGELGLGPENKPLLHFEIRERGKPVNPANLLPARANSG